MNNNTFLIISVVVMLTYWLLFFLAGLGGYLLPGPAPTPRRRIAAADLRVEQLIMEEEGMTSRALHTTPARPQHSSSAGPMFEVPLSEEVVAGPSVPRRGSISLFDASRFA